MDETNRQCMLIGAVFATLGFIVGSVLLKLIGM